jgi:hypothetical protein
MPHETINSDGTISYRTKLLRDLQFAARFARCLRANATRFCDVEIVPSLKAKGDAWYVSFRPINRERQIEMLERQADARRQRAAEEGLDYIFWADPDHTGSYWCFNPKSGETYEVSIFSCTCPDYEFRCKRAAIQCKHQQAWELQKSLGVFGQTDKQAETSEQRRARIAASIAADFP